MHILHRLWRGEIAPTERCVRPGSVYHKITTQRSNAMDQFVSALSPASISDEESFLFGFRMGAQMMLDVARDYKGEFYSYDDKTLL